MDDNLTRFRVKEGNTSLISFCWLNEGVCFDRIPCKWDGGYEVLNDKDQDEDLVVYHTYIIYYQIDLDFYEPSNDPIKFEIRPWFLSKSLYHKFLEADQSVDLESTDWKLVCKSEKKQDFSLESTNSSPIWLNLKEKNHIIEGVRKRANKFDPSEITNYKK